MTSPNTEKLQDHLTARCKQRNGGDVAVCPQKNFRYRSTTLKQIDAAMVAEERLVCNLVNDGLNLSTMVDVPRATPIIDPSWAPPVAGQPWTGVDIRQHVLRNARDGKQVYAPERWGVRELLHDFFAAPFIFPWRSQLLPHTPSARKLHARVLSPTFRFPLPGTVHGCSSQRVLDREQFFQLMFDHLVPSFPDLAFNINMEINPPSGPESNGDVAFTVKITGTHTGAPFGPLGLTPVAAAGTRVQLPMERWTARMHDLCMLHLASDATGGSAFPLGLYRLIGGSL